MMIIYDGIEDVRGTHRNQPRIENSDDRPSGRMRTVICKVEKHAIGGKEKGARNKNRDGGFFHECAIGVRSEVLHARVIVITIVTIFLARAQVTVNCAQITSIHLFLRLSPCPETTLRARYTSVFHLTDLTSIDAHLIRMCRTGPTSPHRGQLPSPDLHRLRSRGHLRIPLMIRVAFPRRRSRRTVEPGRLIQLRDVDGFHPQPFHPRTGSRPFGHSKAVDPRLVDSTDTQTCAERSGADTIDLQRLMGERNFR